jgi:hypothetical protein
MKCVLVSLLDMFGVHYLGLDPVAIAVEHASFGQQT